MAASEHNPTVPRVFISYSCDDVGHKEWVKQLATRMRADGIDVTLGLSYSSHDDKLLALMERAIRERDFVIAICTPLFKERSEASAGGVGFEGDIMTSLASSSGDKRKFIPVLRRGRWTEAAPTWLFGRRKIDLSEDPYSESEYNELLRTPHVARQTAPTMTGTMPDYFQNEGDDAQRSRVGWLGLQAGLEDAFFSRYLRVNETAFEQWLNHSALLPPGADVDLRALWRTVQHLLSFLNFDSQRVKTLLLHRVPGVSPGQVTSIAPPWAGSSLIDYLEENGAQVLPEIDRWVTALRFGDPYPGILVRTSSLKAAHAG
jgi:TIR domain